MNWRNVPARWFVILSSMLSALFVLAATPATDPAHAFETAASVRAIDQPSWTHRAEPPQQETSPGRVEDLGQVEYAKPKTGQLSSALHQLVQARQRSGLLQAAQEKGARVEGEQVLVTIQSQSGRLDAAIAAVAASGGRTTANYRDYLDAYVPVDALPTLAEHEAIHWVELPTPLSSNVVGEGVSLIGAPTWHARGANGSGVRVGIVDTGFAGYTSLLGTELPAQVDTSCSQRPPTETSSHGTGVAEIVHEVAPGAELYFAAVSTTTEIGNAVACLAGKGVTVVNASITAAAYQGPGNGTGLSNQVVDDAVSRGIFWTNSAGNEAQHHWAGVWNNPDADLFHNFAPNDEGQTLYLNSGVPLVASLRWNDPWGTSANDFDLLLADSAGEWVAWSIHSQNGSQNPVETLSFTPAYSGTYAIVIGRLEGSSQSWFDLLASQSLEYQVAGNSLPHPADSANPGMVSVGAVPWSSPTVLRDYSSQGPTTDGRLKPDLVAPDGVSNATYSGGFTGTSASSPHVAGAAALVKQANPSLGPSGLRTYLESLAIDLGAPGKDNQFGSGRLTVLAPLSAGYNASPPTNWNTGQTQSYSITLTNTGTQVWNATGPNPVRLGVSFGGDSDVPGVGWATDQRIDLPDDVAPGASVTFTINVTPPTSGGSYVLRHRMVKTAIAWFPELHKTNVTVTPLRSATYNVNPPINWDPRQPQTYSITLTNSGSQAWNATGPNPVRLGIHFGGDSDVPGVGWATDQRFDLPNDVAPGDSVTMNVTVSAPWTGGSYVLRHRMVKTGIAWFDQIHKTNVTVIQIPPLSATYTVTPPTTWSVGQAQSYSITLNNVGSQTWNATGANPVRLGVSFGGDSDVPGVGWVTDQRINLPGDVAPGATVTFTIIVTAPATGGNFVLRHRMVKTGIAWFPEIHKTNVVVTPLRGATYNVVPPTTWVPGQPQTYSITLTNSGSQAWNATGPNPVRLGIHFGGDSDVPGVGWATDQRFDLPNDVAPGDSVTMNVTVSAPWTGGSYVLRHRMVKTGIAWFDQIHKTNVTVIQIPPLSATYTVTPPANWNTGQTQSYSVTLNNVGSQTWNATGANPVRLGVSFGGDSDVPGVGWATDLRINIPADVAPGASVTFTINVTAPLVGGNYTLRHRLVKTGIAWFPELHKTNVTVTQPLAASYISTPPTTWNSGYSQTYSITITNSGSQAWNATGPNPVRLGVHFGGASDTPGAGWATDQRFDLPNDVAPGDSVTMNVTVTAPVVGGSYTLRHRMLKTAVAWFDQIQKTPVIVNQLPMLASTFAFTPGNPPTNWTVGIPQSYNVTVTNTGAETWRAAGANRVRLGISFGGASDVPGVGWAPGTDQRFDLPADVAPGTSVTIAVTVTPPATGGNYVLRHRMVKTAVAWFPELHKTDVTVASG